MNHTLIIFYHQFRYLNYKIINTKALGERIGLNQTLLSQYINGHKKPSVKQVQRILQGLRDLGRELMQVDLQMSKF